MMMMVKFLHVATISIWAAGLVSLPGLYVQRANIGNKDDLFRLQRIVRFAYVRVLSPAAFLAIASGIGLIFLQQPFSCWFSLKLALVGLLVVIHVLTGLVIIRLFGKGEVYPRWRFMLVTAASGFVAGAIIFVVLARPELDLRFSDGIFEAGALKGLVSSFSPWEIP